MVIDATVRTAFIVVFTPVADSYLCVEFIDEPFAIEAIIAKAAVETFDITILPRRAWREIDTIDLTRLHPVLNRSGHELRALLRIHLGAP